MATSIPALVGITPGVRVLVAGGTGTIGSGITLALLKQGAKVVVATRSKERYEELQHFVPEKYRHGLTGVVGDVSTEKGVHNVLKETSGPETSVRHVVATLGSWWQKGQLIHQTLHEFNEVIRERVASNFLMMKTFIPHLNQLEGTTYTIVTGNAGYEYLAPETSLLCVASGARNALGIVARTEFRDMPVAMNELHIRCHIIPKEDKTLPKSDPFTIGNDLIGAAITSSIVARNRGMVVIGNRQDARKLIKLDTEIM